MFNNRVNFQWLKKHPNLHSIIIGACLIMFWRAIWDLLDMYFMPSYPMLSIIIPGVVALLVLYFNDSRLKEIE